jgi:hypothetical protein
MARSSPVKVSFGGAEPSYHILADCHAHVFPGFRDHPVDPIIPHRRLRKVPCRALDPDFVAPKPSYLAEPH